MTPESKVRSAEPPPRFDRVFLSGVSETYDTSTRGRTVGLSFLNFDKDDAFRIEPARVRLTLRCEWGCPRSITRTLNANETGVVPSTRGEFGRPHAVVTVSLPSSLPAGLYSIKIGGYKVDAFGPGLISIPPASTKGIPDAHLRNARARYVGRTVQGFGALNVACNADVGSPGEEGLIALGNEPSLRVVGVDRPSSRPSAWPPKTDIAGPPNVEVASFVVIDPLRVRFSPLPGCAAPHMWLPDDWAMALALWIHAPIGIDANTPIRPGLTRLSVAHILGFPATFGTLRDFEALDTWSYLRAAPFSYFVHFKGNVVSRYDPPGHLP